MAEAGIRDRRDHLSRYLERVQAGERPRGRATAVIAYVDTSTLISLIIDEPGSERAGRVRDTAEHLTSVRLIYAEACAALAQAARPGRLSGAHLERSRPRIARHARG